MDIPVDDKIMEMALEMLSVISVTEVAFGQGVQTLMSKEAKAGDNAIREARKFKKTDPKKAKAKYKEAITHYEKLRNEAKKIDDEDGWDWVINLCIKPMYMLFYQMLDTGQISFKGLTRNHTIKIIDDCIAATRREMEKLN